MWIEDKRYRIEIYRIKDREKRIKGTGQRIENKR